MLITGEARRDAAWFLPPGYAAVRNRAVRCSPPIWAEALSPWACPWHRQTCSPGRSVSPPGAAMLRLCPDGRVYLNGVEITPAGTAEKGGQSHGSDAS